MRKDPTTLMISVQFVSPINHASLRGPASPMETVRAQPLRPYPESASGRALTENHRHVVQSFGSTGWKPTDRFGNLLGKNGKISTKDVSWGYKTVDKKKCFFLSSGGLKYNFTHSNLSQVICEDMIRIWIWPPPHSHPLMRPMLAITTHG